MLGYSAITDQYSFGLNLSIPAVGNRGLNTGDLNSDGPGTPWSGLSNSAF